MPEVKANLLYHDTEPQKRLIFFCPFSSIFELVIISNNFKYCLAFDNNIFEVTFCVI